MWKYFFFIILGSLLFSCGDKSDLKFIDKTEKLRDGLVPFNELKSTVFARQCIGCHKGFKDEKNLYRYINEENRDESILYLCVKNGNMPRKRTPLSSQYLETVRLYVNQIHVPHRVAFKELSEKVLEKNCFHCHSNFKDQKNLSPYLNEDEPEKSLLLTAIENKNVHKESPKLSSLQTEMILNFTENSEVIRENVTFHELNEKILVPKCVGCHKKAISPEGISRWVNSDEPLRSKFLTSTESGSMPKHAPMLKKSEISLINSYLLGLKP